MKRSKPLRRRAWITQRRPTKRRSDRVEDPGILHDVHELRCSARSLPGARCYGPIQADHAGRRPYGRLCHDTEVIALCQRCHADRTNASTRSGGPFSLMTPEQRRTWCDAMIAATQTWYYGRPLEAADLVLVAEAVAAGRYTRGLLATEAA